MRNTYSYLLLSVAILFAVIVSCRQSSQEPIDVPVYIFPPQENQTEIETEDDTPVITAPQDDDEKEYVVRNIVVDQQNSVFSIGIPAGQREETRVTAQKPIDFWFEYLPAEAKLVVDGEEIQRDPFHWETKVKYTTSVTEFEYRISNTTGDYISYNLHLVPSISGQSVPVIIRQNWIP